MKHKKTLANTFQWKTRQQKIDVNFFEFLVALAYIEVLKYTFFFAFGKWKDTACM